MSKFAFGPSIASSGNSIFDPTGLGSGFSLPTSTGGGSSDNFLTTAQSLGATRLWSPANFTLADVDPSSNTMEDLLNTGTYAASSTNTDRFGAGKDVDIRSSGLTAKSLSNEIFVKAGSLPAADNEVANHVSRALTTTNTDGTWFFVLNIQPMTVGSTTREMVIAYQREDNNGTIYNDGHVWVQFRGGLDIVALNQSSIPRTGDITLGASRIVSAVYTRNSTSNTEALYFTTKEYTGTYPEEDSTLSPIASQTLANSVLMMANNFSTPSAFGGAGCLAAVYFPTALSTTDLGTLHSAIT
jgi:hypothetical protein